MTTIYYTPTLLVADRQVRTGHNILTVKNKIVPITNIEGTTTAYAVGIGNSSAVAALIEYLQQTQTDPEYPFPEWIEPESALVLYVCAECNDDDSRTVLLYDSSPYPIEMDSTKAFAIGAGADFINQYNKYRWSVFHTTNLSRVLSTFGMAIDMPFIEWDTRKHSEYMTYVVLDKEVINNGN